MWPCAKIINKNEIALKKSEIGKKERAAQ